MLNVTIGFLGAGKMAQALARGLIEKEVVPRDRIVMSDTDDAVRVKVANALHVRVVEENEEVVREGDVVIVALKPDVVRRELPKLKERITEAKLLVSIAAGVRLAELREMLLPSTRIVRVMPNTPCQVGSGASVFTPGPVVNEGDADLVNEILASVGISYCVAAEDLLDAVTGLSGSGPAYAALVIEALADGGVLCGLPREMALNLAAQTVLGAARLIQEAGLHPGQLKDMVASPGGTTIEGLQVLEEHGVRAALIDAVEAATLKSRALGEK